MNIQTLILAILNFGDATGYEIKKQSTEGGFSFFVDISYGTIYPTLAKLEQEGLVICASHSQEGRPDKKIYSITKEGRSAFVKLLDTVPQMDKFKSEFLLIAMCADLCNRTRIEAALDKQIEEVRVVLDIMNRHDFDHENPARQWVTNFGKYVKQAALDYLIENREALCALAGSGLSGKDAAQEQLFARTTGR